MLDSDDPGFATKLIRKELDTVDGHLKLNILYD